MLDVHKSMKRNAVSCWLSGKGFLRPVSLVVSAIAALVGWVEA
ncbi:MAG: hypothetical protein NW220_05570 [Leptolyngbyaceae cyanobacterium bins.349]|nr:hypothetical protein [Leptolyngbyaceae cyanobacterium bins.349]